MGLPDTLERHAPAAAEAIRLLGGPLAGDTSLAETVAVLLQVRAAIAEDPVARYRALRDLVRNAAEQHVTPLLSALAESLPPDSDLRVAIDEILRPSLLDVTSFALDRLDRLADEGIAGALSTFTDSTPAALGLVVYRVLARSLVVLDRILTEHVTGAISQSCINLEAAIRQDRTHPMVTGLRGLAEKTFPGLGALSDDAFEALGPFVAELASIGAEMYGPAVYTEERLRRMADLKLQILGAFDRGVNRADPADVARFFVEELARCAFVPNPGPSVELLLLMLDILRDQVLVVVGRAAGGLGPVLLGQDLQEVLGLDRRVADTLGPLLAEDSAARAALQEASRALADAEAALGEANAGLIDQVNALVEMIRDSTALRQVMEAVHARGVERARATARPPLYPEEAAVAAYELEYAVSRVVIEAIVEAADLLPADLRSILIDATSPADAMTRVQRALWDRARNGSQPARDAATAPLPAVFELDRLFQAVVEQFAQAVEPVVGDAWQAAEQVGARAAETATAATALQQAAEKRDRAARAVGERGLPENAAVTVWSPALDTGAGLPVTTVPVPLRVRISGLGPASVARAALSLNGVLLAATWTDDDDGRLSEQMLTLGQSGLREGLNLLVVSLLDGRSAPRREVFRFGATA